MISESVIRDNLAENLTVVEVGLRLIETEFHLANSAGTRGRVDILARDRHGLWVIIEIKRSRSSSREALQEIAKYTELLQREKGIRPDRIRAILLSTTWAELLVPTSNFVRDWRHDLACYSLGVDEDGVVTQVEPVQLLPMSFQRAVTPIHFIYFGRDARHRDELWGQAVTVAAEVGATDLLGLKFRRIARRHEVVASHGIYIAIGNVDPSGADPSVLDGYDGPEPFAAQYPVEYLVLCRITSRVFGVTSESAIPGTIRQITGNPAWQVEDYVASGRISDRSLHDVDDAIRALRGDDPGQGQIKFTGSCNPSNTQRLRSFMAELRHPLSGNPDWEMTLMAWIEDCIKEHHPTDLLVDIYNPCDFVGTLVHGWPERVPDFTPLVIGAVRFDDGRVREVRGGLVWNSSRVIDLTAQIKFIYSDPWKWIFAGSAGVRWEYDQLLLESLGLTYVLIESTRSPSDPDQGAGALWFTRDGDVYSEDISEAATHGGLGLFTSDSGSIDTLTTMLRANAHEIDQLVSSYQRINAAESAQQA